jgi:hypothetical protein
VGKKRHWGGGKTFFAWAADNTERALTEMHFRVPFKVREYLEEMSD